jgi:hypothetical protein
MGDKSDEESDEAIDRWQRWLREEGARISARAKNEETKTQIADLIEKACRILSHCGRQLPHIQKFLESVPIACEKLLNPPPPKGIARFPIEGQSLGDQWRELCLWLTVTAQQIIGETNATKLKGDIRAQLQSLTHETRRPHTIADLRLCVTKFGETVAEWTNARMETVLSRPPGQRASH